MKKSTIIIIVVVALLAIWGVSGYNGLVTMDENVSGQWSNVETQYQRRADLIPNLVNTVKGYASHEKETLEGVVEARSKATQMTVDANDLTPEKLAEYQKAQGAVTSALGKLLAITENYPDLKANQNFLELQAQLEGTENRINVAHVPTSTMRRRILIRQSAASPKTFLPVFSALRSVPTLKPPKEANKHLRWSSKETELNIKYPLIRCRTRTDLQVRCRMRGYFLRKAKAISEIITTFALN